MRLATVGVTIVVIIVVVLIHLLRFVWAFCKAHLFVLTTSHAHTKYSPCIPHVYELHTGSRIWCFLWNDVTCFISADPSVRSPFIQLNENTLTCCCFLFACFVFKNNYIYLPSHGARLLNASRNWLCVGRRVFSSFPAFSGTLIHSNESAIQIYWLS